MKNRTLFFMIFVPFFCFAQVNDSFLDGNFINNPNWSGTDANFYVNSSLQLQSKATTSSTSYLFTPSEAIENASWESWVKITYTTSSSNYASVYLISDTWDISNGCYGYFVQIGGTNDEVSLYLQEGTKKTKIIDGTDKRTDGNPVELTVKVTRDNAGNFSLFSKLSTETEYVLEGTVQNEVVKASSYFGLLYSNTNSTGSDYYFDDIIVTGDKMEDLEEPEWRSIKIVQPNLLVLSFSEAMDFSHATFTVEQDMNAPSSVVVSQDKKSIELEFPTNFEKGMVYHLYTSGLTDLAGNLLAETEKETGIPESIEFGDLVFNEVMFENHENSLEYIEIVNTSDKLLDVSGLVVTSRKTDGTLNTGIKIPVESLLLPNAYLALCSDANVVKAHHNCPAESNVLTTDTWSALNNESATLVLTTITKDTIYDEFTYSSKWHHPLIKNPKGVALEKINPAMDSQDASSWHSAASEVNYGTPGYQNSQYRELESTPKTEKTFSVEPEAFSPDNDGVDDICFIRYKTDSNGYIANGVILNAVGIKVYQLVTNSLLSTEGFFTWDGKTDSGKNANVGIYIIYFEIFNPENGQRKQQKIPVVVSSR